jgi:hypothetical protein
LPKRATTGSTPAPPPPGVVTAAPEDDEEALRAPSRQEGGPALGHLGQVQLTGGLEQLDGERMAPVALEGLEAGDHDGRGLLGRTPQEAREGRCAQGRARSGIEHEPLEVAVLASLQSLAFDGEEGLGDVGSEAIGLCLVLERAGYTLDIVLGSPELSDDAVLGMHSLAHRPEAVHGHGRQVLHDLAVGDAPSELALAPFP